MMSFGYGTVSFRMLFVDCLPVVAPLTAPLLRSTCIANDTAVTCLLSICIYEPVDLFIFLLANRECSFSGGMCDNWYTKGEGCARTIGIIFSPYLSSMSFYNTFRNKQSQSS